MKTGPDIALIGSLIGDPARANILNALMGGRALTATELAYEAGVTPQTASSHLAKLQVGGLLALEKQGRHRYFRLANADVAHALEAVVSLADQAGHKRVQTGPKDPAMRHARVCYDHLAGELGVQMFDHLTRRKLLDHQGSDLSLTRKGRLFCEEFGLDVLALDTAKRPLCRICLDWSVRRSHLAGALGAALLTRITDLKWAQRDKTSRTVIFTRRGEEKFADVFGSVAI
jgi:DNA-binding transcriptional ArsR family regulator